MARLFEHATAAYDKCRFVVTTRPATYSGLAALDGFHQARVEELDREAISVFLGHWAQSLFPENDAAAETHRRSWWTRWVRGSRSGGWRGIP
jgi:hypothetical protein